MEHMPVQKAWDHAIELKERFIPKKGKVYSLSREEQEEVCHDLAKQLGHYLYFFSFSFHLIRKSTDAQEGMTQRRCMRLYK